jgi:beta-phosphoglucomutase-like phosphatase (HAD superfamily)
VAWNFPLPLPNRTFSGFIFDCDGTLIDSMPLHFHAWRYALKQQAAPFDFTDRMHHEQAGTSIPDSVLLFNHRFGCALDPEKVEKARIEYLFSHLDELRLVDPVVAVARAHFGKIPLAVASGSARAIVERELDHFSLSGLFAAVVTAEDAARSKPAPDIFLLAAQRLGVPPTECLVFEDGRNGIIAATAAGMESVYIPTND